MRAKGKSPKFEVGDQIYLAEGYYVYRPGDCKNDSNIADCPLGTKGKIIDLDDVGPDDGGIIAEVKWYKPMRDNLWVNASCLEKTDPTPKEIREAMTLIKEAINNEH